MIIDLTLLALLLLAGWLGFRQSAFRFVLPLLEWIVGIYLLMKLTPPLLRLIHGALNPEPRMAFLFVFILLVAVLGYLALRINRLAAGYFQGKGGGTAGNVVKGVTAVLLVLLIAGWILHALEGQNWLPYEAKRGSHAYPVLHKVNRVTGFASIEFARAFDDYSRTIGRAFTARHDEIPTAE